MCHANMNLLNVTATLLATTLWCAAPADAQTSPWDDYSPSTLASAASEIRFSQPCNLCFTPGIPYTIVARFTGQVRPIALARKELVHGWLRSIGSLEGSEEIFSSEICVIEAGTRWWLPIQHELVQHVVSENPNGGVIEIRAVLIGVRDANSPEKDHVFAVNGFSSLDTTSE